MGLLTDQSEEGLRLYKAGSPDYQRGYDRGWDDAYHELAQRDETSTPPWFRRFFWYPIEKYDKKDRRKLLHLNEGHDEWCNPVFGIRLKGGVLHIRYSRKLRLPTDGRCAECIAEDAVVDEQH